MLEYICALSQISTKHVTDSDAHDADKEPPQPSREMEDRPNFPPNHAESDQISSSIQLSTEGSCTVPTPCQPPVKYIADADQRIKQVKQGGERLSHT